MDQMQKKEHEPMKKNERFFSFPVRLSDEVERLFDEIIHRPWGFVGELRPWNPSIDLYEIADAFILEADLPGVDSKDVKVEVEGNVLILQGSRSIQHKHGSGLFYFQERCSGDFTRRLTLPESVDKKKIKAEFTDGVLRVVLPKTGKGARHDEHS
jgi:HSP20 family protein